MKNNLKFITKLSTNIDFKRNNIFMNGIVIGINHLANITAKTCIVKFENNDTRLLLCPQGLKIGAKVISGIEVPILLGNHLLLKNLPLGTDIYNVELYPGCGGQMARAGGAFINVIAKEGLFVTVRLPSGEVRLISKYCWSTVGRVAEKNLLRKIVGKAGRNRWIGKRPHVRGVVKNPVDHPHGGGEGRSPIGRSHPVTPWGRVALGQRTRSSKRYSDLMILSRRK
jgi:large subunit ribosomal protein L2